MKFKIGDKVRKVSGYRFDGTVIGLMKTTTGQVRYSVQIDATNSRRDVNEIADTLLFDDETREFLLLAVSNCDGMIHIFSEEQLNFRI